MKNNTTITSLYRVQGGKFPSRSRNTLLVNNNNLIECSRTKNIYIGDHDHMSYFLLKRLGIQKISDFNETNNTDVHVIEIQVPYWFTFLLENYAVKQFKSKDINYPKLVDNSIPGHSYQISKDWSELLKASCIYANDHVIETKDDIINLMFSTQSFDKRRALDYKGISPILHKCKIEKNDIETLKQVWGVRIIGKGEVEK